MNLGEADWDSEKCRMLDPRCEFTIRSDGSLILFFHQGFEGGKRIVARLFCTT
jgi:hypothetical protein